MWSSRRTVFVAEPSCKQKISVGSLEIVAACYFYLHDDVRLLVPEELHRPPVALKARMLYENSPLPGGMAPILKDAAPARTLCMTMMAGMQASAQPTYLKLGDGGMKRLSRNSWSGVSIFQRVECSSSFDRDK